MKLLAVFAVLALLLAPAVQAVDNSKWCGTIVAIYGICSPELVDNYIKMTSAPPKLPNTIHTPSGNFTTVQLVKAGANELPPVVDTKNMSVGERAELPNVKYSWYYNGQIWVRSRLYK
jgi:hypothetical protein